MVAPATSPAHLAVRVRGLQTDFNAEIEIICSLICKAVAIDSRHQRARTAYQTTKLTGISQGAQTSFRRVCGAARSFAVATRSIAKVCGSITTP